MQPDQLEELRLLTNAEMDSASPFAGIFAGQPTLNRQLRMGMFAALDQRIATRFTIKPMDLAESAAYLRHHLKLAGRDDPLFADDAIARLHRVANGLPAPSTTPPPRRSSPPPQPARTSSTMPAPGKPSPSSPATSRTTPGGPATLNNPAVAARVRQLASQAGHRRAIAEFHTRRTANQQARLDALLLEAIAALASLLGAPGPPPARQPGLTSPPTPAGT